MIDVNDLFIIGRIVDVADSNGGLLLSMGYEIDWEKVTSIYIKSDDGHFFPYFIESNNSSDKGIVLNLSGVETKEDARIFINSNLYLANSLKSIIK
jgi:ribosomal 30S subunit maturation factor RimM